jgi:hypothetical protein
MLRVAAVTSLLATLTSAEIAGGLFSSCPGGAGITDPYVMTQQFWNEYVRENIFHVVTFLQHENI